MILRERIQSIGYALCGLRELIKQPNTVIHLLATIVVVVAGIIQSLQVQDWGLLTLAIGMVWIAEAFNTALEKLCDLVCDGKYHPVIKLVKDLAAASVLIAAATSICVGITVFFF